MRYHDQTTAGDGKLNVQDLGDGFGGPREQRVFLDGNDLIDTLVAYDAAGRIQVSCNPTKIVVSTFALAGTFIMAANLVFYAMLVQVNARLPDSEKL